MLHLLGFGGNPQVDEMANSRRAQQEAQINFSFRQMQDRLQNLETRISKLEASPDVSERTDLDQN